MASNTILDTRGLLCPMPVIRTQDLVKTLPSGTRVTVLASDPGALHDIPAWCRIHGHTMVSTLHDGQRIELELEVCS